MPHVPRPHIPAASLQLAAVRDPRVREVPLLEYFSRVRGSGDPRAVMQVQWAVQGCDTPLSPGSSS